MVRGVTRWDQPDGWANQYRCSIAYYLMSCLSKEYDFFYRSIDTPGYGKYLVNVYNTVQKRYLATCLRMRSKPEVDKIYSRHICVDDMTEKGEVRFYEECRRLLDIHDEIGTKADKKHVKRKA